MPRAVDPWNTMGAISPIDAIERAVKAYRKARTETEKRAELTKIRALVGDIERHVDNFDPGLRRLGIPERDPRVA